MITDLFEVDEDLKREYSIKFFELPHKPIDEVTWRALQKEKKEYIKAVKAGERFVKKSKIKTGGTCLPGAPGWENFYEVVNECS